MNETQSKTPIKFLSAFICAYLRPIICFFWFCALAAAGSSATPAADLARAIRENSFDPAECYRVRDLRLAKQDISIYLTDGHLIFAKPVAGRRIAAVFVADTEGGDAEVIIMPPDRAERRSLATYIHSPTLDEHFRNAIFLFTGDDYAALVSQMADNPANRKAPEVGALLDEQYTPTLHNIVTSYLTRLVLDLLNASTRPPGLFAALVTSPKLGSFDVLFDPSVREQITAGQLARRDNRLYFDAWTNFAARATRHSAPPPDDLAVSDYRIQATLQSDLSLDVVTRMKVQPRIAGLRAMAFDITPQMHVSSATIDGRPAEVLQRESLRSDARRGGNSMFLVVPPEPPAPGVPHEIEIHHSGRVILAAGDRVFYVSARGNWYPMHGSQFATYDLTFRHPKDLQMVGPGDVIEDRTEEETRITRRRTPAPIREAAFNLGNYSCKRVERDGYVVDVCANKELERALMPSPLPQILPRAPTTLSRRSQTTMPPPSEAPPDPLQRLEGMASDVASAVGFMAAKFGPPALPHLTVSPIPGTFGQGFPGLVYLSTLSYLNKLPSSFIPPANAPSETTDLFFQNLLQVHEAAHQWWGNRVVSAGYRDQWLMEALANYSSLLYLEKTRGRRVMDMVLDHYRASLLEKGTNEATVDSAGPIVLGARLASSPEPAAWRAITYGKGTWIVQMLRSRLGDANFFAMLAALAKRYDRKELSTEEFREFAAGFLPPKSDDPHLETFFDQWVYGTGIPTLKLSYTVRRKAPAVRLTATVTQSGVGDDFETLAPVEIQVARGHAITRWVRCSNDPATLTLSLKAPPLKVVLDPNHAVLRKP